MFKVKSLIDGHVYTVYAVSGSMFIVWNDQTEHWEWMPLELFKPEENVHAN